METAILVRHGESRFSVRAAANGDPTACGGLTEAGRGQALALGSELAAERIDLCVTTEFARARETADLALAGRDVPRLVLAELNEIRFGAYEGAALDEYRAWAWTAGPGDECPGGGESRAAAALRYARGFRTLLERPEACVLVVAHTLPIRYLLDAAAGREPARRVAAVGYATPSRLDARELETAVERVELWCERPVFA